MARDVDGLALTMIAGGSLLAYSGVKGYSIPHAVTAFIRGELPGGQPQYPISGSAAASGDPGAAGGSSAAAANFEKYVGKVPYVWGGATPAGWDCSGSCNYVLCHDTGLPIPGYKAGTFTGANNDHGPSTYTWAFWAAAGNLKRLASQSDTQSGDIVLWLSHMGIVTDGGDYVSAYDTQEGTASNPIHGGGPFGEVATFWRYP